MSSGPGTRTQFAGFKDPLAGPRLPQLPVVESSHAQHGSEPRRPARGRAMCAFDAPTKNGGHPRWRVAAVAVDLLGLATQYVPSAASRITGRWAANQGY